MTGARSDEYDLIVLGGGPVGENVADRAAQGGLSVVVVESELVGGECSYWACIPSKALLRPTQALRAARHVRGAAEAVTGDLDVSAVLARRDWFTGDWSDDGQVRWLESVGIDLVRGHGRLTAEREVTVTDADDATRTLRARHAVVVSTGSDAVIPSIPGLHEARPWTSREATSAQQVPESLVIVGGGVVAAEMAMAYAGLGATVTVLSRSPLLRGMEVFAGERVTAGLRALGVEVRTTVAPASVSRGDDGVTVVLDDGSAVTASEILVATGRSPRTRDIGLEVAGLEPGEWIDVDDTMRVPGSEWLYAVGDANHRALLTHQGKYQARAAGDVIVARANGEQTDAAAWGSHVATADHAAVPQVTFTSPEVASVGLTEASARDAGIDVAVADVEFSSVSGAGLYDDEFDGQARLVIDAERGVVVGATFVGPEVAELLHAATVAIVGEVPIARLWHAVPAFPTISEVWLRLLEAHGRESSR